MQEFLDWISPIWKPHPGQLAFPRARAKPKEAARNQKTYCGPACRLMRNLDCPSLPQKRGNSRTAESKLPHLPDTRHSQTSAHSRPLLTTQSPSSNLMRPLLPCHASVTKMGAKQNLVTPARDTALLPPSAPSSPAPTRPNPQSSDPPAKSGQTPDPRYSSAPQPRA